MMRSTKKQRARAGRPAQFPKAEDIRADHMAMLRAWWAGVMSTEDVAASARELLGCGPVSKPKLYEWLGKRPPNPDRPRKKRSDAGTKRTA